ncbi:MAG: ABC transporter permease, partial [Gallionella sp.]|nr:ABC transporter permease [Gallionella sp.]
MNFTIEFLWSDRLIFLLLAAVGVSVWHVRRHEHLLLPWWRVGRSSVAMVSLLVLSLFLVVGFLDSLHYRAALPQQNGAEKVYSSEVLSVFDKLVTPLRTQTEKTYSAPFAVTLYAKESITDAQGKVRRDYPRLKYGGAHLQDETQRGRDILKRLLIGVLGGLLVGILFVGIALSFCWGRFNNNPSRPPLVRGGDEISGTSFAPPLTRGGREGLHLLRKAIAQHAAVIASALILSILIGATVCLADGYHVLGTDKVGQDVLYLSLKSIRTGLVIGTVTTLVTLPLALLLGIAAGYFRGWVDDVIQYIYTVLSSIPSVLLIAAAVLMMQVIIETHPQWFTTSASRADLRLVF